MRIAAIDVGGTKTSLGIVDCPGGTLTALETVASPENGSDHRAFLTDLASRAAALVRDHGAQAIGVSVCELVSPHGQVTSGHRIRWQDLDVAGAFRAAAPASIESDVRAAALAEARLGAGKGASSFLYVNIGTGISSALVLDGKVHAGARGNALALASSPVEMKCPHCGVIASQVLEDVAGGEGLLRIAQARGLKLATAADIFEKGNARDIAEAASLALGVTLGIAINLLDPELVILGGGLILASDRYREAVIAATRAHIWADATRRLPIVTATLGPHAALIGAGLRAAELVEAKRAPGVRQGDGDS
jgi:glucokinase